MLERIKSIEKSQLIKAILALVILLIILIASTYAYFSIGTINGEVSTLVEGNIVMIICFTMFLQTL